MRILKICLFLSSNILLGLTVGSYSAVTNQTSAVNFPSGETNLIQGYIKILGGFTLASSATSCTFDGLFPVSGTFSFGGGSLYLSRNLFFNNSSTLDFAGTVYGTSKTLSLPKSIEPVEINAGFVSTQKSIGDTPTVPYSVDWSYNNTYIAVGASGEEELTVFSFNGTTTAFVDGVGGGTGDDAWFEVFSTRWHPSNLFLSAAGIKYGGGGRVSIYELTVAPLALVRRSLVDLTPNSATAVDWSPNGNYIAVGTEVAASWNEVRVYPVNGSGVLSSVINSYDLGVSVINNGIVWDSTGQYFACAGGTTLYVFYFNDPTLTLTTSVNIGSAISALDWGNSTNIAVGLSAGSEKLRVYNFNYTTKQLSENTSARTAETVNVLAAHWKPGDAYLGVGKATSASAVNLYSYSSTLASLWSLNLANNVPAVRWSPNGNYLAAATLANQLRIYSFDTGSITLDNTVLALNSEANLNATLYFGGNSVLDGNYNILDLNTLGNIILNSNANLVLRNAVIKNVSSNNIRCSDATGKITFNNVSLALNNNFNFATGYFDVLEELRITGNHIFTYSSTLASAIKNNSTLYLDYGATFSYVSSTPSLLAMEDVTSSLCLDGAVLYSGTNGLYLTKGTLAIGRKSYLTSKGSVGIVFGDGASAVNNLRLIGDANLELTQGSILNYKNLD